MTPGKAEVPARSVCTATRETALTDIPAGAARTTRALEQHLDHYFGLVGPQFEGRIKPAVADGYLAYVPSPRRGLNTLTFHAAAQALRFSLLLTYRLTVCLIADHGGCAEFLGAMPEYLAPSQDAFRIVPLGVGYADPTDSTSVT